MPAAHAVRLKMNHTHLAMIDFILARPDCTQDEICARFGYRQPTVSAIVNSDLFQATLAARRDDVVDPILTRTIEERLGAIAQASLDGIANQLDNQPSPGYLLDVAKFAVGAKGYGLNARAAQAALGPQVVINVTGVAPSDGAWESKWAGDRLEEVVDAHPRAAAPRQLDHSAP